jgi:restriction enzyme, beta subunit/N-6 DNA methylase
MIDMTSSWKNFSISYLFNIYTGGDLVLYNIDYGNIPIVTHSKKNQGVEYYSKEIPDRKLFSHKRTLSLADRGNFISFVQEEDFYIGTRVKALELKEEHCFCDKSILLFLATMINYESFRFDYGRNATHRLDNLMIKLPAKQGIPDWDFMSDYIKNIEYNIISNVKNRFLNSNLSKFNISDYSYKFKNVKIVEYLEFSSSVDQIDKVELENNSITDNIYPYITRTSKNNGIESYICEQFNRKRNLGNCITIGLDTQTLAFQDVEFYTGQNIQILRHKKLNKYNALFIITIMKMELYKYGWSRGLTKERLEKFTCNLPFKNNELDWEFMENYIKSITYSKFI